MWKCLHDDPETAKLLKKIYGIRPEINYPKIKTIPRANLPPTPQVKDPKQISKKTNKGVRVPKFRGNARDNGVQNANPAIIRRSQRKPGPAIAQEQAELWDKIAHYRPPFIKPIGDNEKERLAERFEFGGGKALPDEMTTPAGTTPSEERWKQLEANRVARVRRRRKGLPEEVVKDFGHRGEGDSLEFTMFDQVASEIEERQKFLLDARASGVPFDDEPRIKAEISQRISELDRLRKESHS
ncbi:unnamed protein product [Choristocarpus tenellus]